MKATECKPRTDKECAAVFDVTDRQFRNWKAEAWFPKDAKTADGWDVARIRAARDAEGRKGSEISKEREERRKQREDVELSIKREQLVVEQLKRAQLEGELFPRDAANLVFSIILTQIRDFCDQQPSLTGRLVGKEERAAVETEMKRAGDAFCSSLKKQIEVALREWDDSNK